MATSVAVLLILCISYASAGMKHLDSSQQNMVFDQGQGGSYQFSYDTGTGGFHQQQGSAGGAVSGKYGFSGPSGSNVDVSYSTGGGGGGSGSSGFGADFSAGNSGSYSMPVGGNGRNGGAGKGTMTMNLSPSGVYSYDYKLNDQSKSESRGADGKVRGMFSYTGKDGQERSLTYTADEGGFQPIGAHLPKDDGQAAMAALNGYSGSSSSNGYSGYSGNGFSSSGQSYGGMARGGGGTGTLSMNLSPGGIYSYDYTLNDQAKSESRGADGRVKGKFSYTGLDGQKKSIAYTADEGGFQPVGDHIPKADEALLNALASSASSSGFSGNGYSGGNGFQKDYDDGSEDPSNFGIGGSVEGSYSINSMGGQQQSSYNAGPSGFTDSHNIRIQVGNRNGGRNGGMGGMGMGGMGMGGMGMMMGAGGD